MTSCTTQSHCRNLSYPRAGLVLFSCCFRPPSRHLYFAPARHATQGFPPAIQFLKQTTDTIKPKTCRAVPWENYSKSNSHTHGPKTFRWPTPSHLSRGRSALMAVRHEQHHQPLEPTTGIWTRHPIASRASRVIEPDHEGVQEQDRIGYAYTEGAG